MAISPALRGFPAALNRLKIWLAAERPPVPIGGKNRFRNEYEFQIAEV